MYLLKYWFQIIFNPKKLRTAALNILINWQSNFECLYYRTQIKQFCINLEPELGLILKFFHSVQQNLFTILEN